jgi:hypothetical protein
LGIAQSEAEQAQMKKGKWGWASVDSTFEALSKRLPSAETIDHPEFRRKNAGRQDPAHPPFTLMGGGRPKENYRLAERFNNVF